jgi:anti-anti-sigma factor
MQILDERQGEVRIVSIDDHLDTMAAPLLESKLLSIVDGGERQVLIDCASLQYVNSAGLKVILLLAKRLETEGGQLVLCALNHSVMMVFQMIGFDRIMKIAPTREEALALFARPV